MRSKQFNLRGDGALLKNNDKWEKLTLRPKYQAP
jgi:hypothetical protein